jgi:hypothetical protein
MSAPWLLSDSRATKGASTYTREHKGRSRPGTARVSQIATGGYGRGGRGTPADPIARPLYRVICSPALAEITGDGRAWTVSMISALSIPWR